MQLFEGYSAEELGRILATSRWFFGVLIILAAVAGFFTQWLVGQIVAREREDRAKALQRLAAAELELRTSDAKMKDMGTTLGRLTQARRLNDAQLAKLRTLLSAGPRGPVVVLFLVTEWDAAIYARQIASLLVEAGFDAKVSEYVLATLDHDGLFLCTGADGKLSAHASSIKSAFSAVGVPVEAHEALTVAKESGAPPDAAVMIVGNRK